MTSVDGAMDQHLLDLGRVVPIPFRLPTLERICAPASGRLWAIGGRPGSFKTGLVWNMAVNAAQLGRRVLMITLELTPGELALLAVARFSGLGVRRIQAAFAKEHPVGFTSIEQQRFDRARNDLRALDMHLRLHGASTHGREFADILKSATRHHYDAIFLDHVGMVGRSSSNRDRFETLDTTIDGLRSLTDGEIAKGYTPFVCMTTPLGRDREKAQRKDEKSYPRMADFWGSSRIESDADAGIALEKRTTSENNEQQNPVSLVEAFVVKNRHGPHPRIIQLVANGETARVAERLRKEQAEAAESLELAMPPGLEDEPPEPGSNG